MDGTKSARIQLLRGLAIIAVVFIHNTPSGLAQVFCRPFLNFAVGMFLFLSGMLSSADKWNPKKRIAKVLIPYVIWTLLYTISYNIKTPSLILVLCLKNLVTGQAAAIMYFVIVYCEFTLLIPIIDKLAKSKYKYLGFLITPIEIIVMRLIPLLTGYQMNKYISIVMGISCLGWFTYYYLGYLLGNKLIIIKWPTKALVCIWACSIALQMLEGYLYYTMGEANCGTQLKLSSILSGALFVIIAYRFIDSNLNINSKFLNLLGDKSFGIYFSHPAIIAVFSFIPAYSEYIPFPLNAVVVLLCSLICVLIGSRILGKYGKLLAL